MVCKGKTSEKEAYIRRTIWSSEKKNGGAMRNKEERVWEMTELWGKTTEKLWEIPVCYFISHTSFIW